MTLPPESLPIPHGDMPDAMVPYLAVAAELTGEGGDPWAVRVAAHHLGEVVREYRLLPGDVDAQHLGQPWAVEAGGLERGEHAPEPL